MVKIDPLGTTTTTQRSAPAKRKKEVSSTVFSGILSSAKQADGVLEAPPATETAPLSNVTMMLSLQEVSDDEIAVKKALKHGHVTLDILEELRHGLLMGQFSESSVKQLEQLVSNQRSPTNSPKLNAILDDIELRAAVELAKIEVAKAGRDI